jgi:hypothetical protein
MLVLFLLLLRRFLWYLYRRYFRLHRGVRDGGGVVLTFSRPGRSCLFCGGPFYLDCSLGNGVYVVRTEYIECLIRCEDW